MLIQIRHPIVPDWDVRQKRQRPRISGSYDESVYLFDRGSIDEVDCLARDVRDRWLLQNVWMLECVVAEVQVWSMAFHDGDDGVFRYAEQVDGYISAGAGSVSCSNHSVIVMSTYTEAPTTTTRYILTVNKASNIRQEAQLTFPR
jgi:hypothetical protein